MDVERRSELFWKAATWVTLAAYALTILGVISGGLFLLIGP